MDDLLRMRRKRRRLSLKKKESKKILVVKERDEVKYRRDALEYANTCTDSIHDQPYLEGRYQIPLAIRQGFTDDQLDEGNSNVLHLIHKKENRITTTYALFKTGGRVSLGKSMIAIDVLVVDALGRSYAQYTRSEWQAICKMISDNS